MARRGKYLRRSLFPLVVLKQGNAVHRGSLNAGRIDQRMLDSYSHIHLDAKRNAIELALSTPIEDTTAIAADVGHQGEIRRTEGPYQMRPFAFSNRARSRDEKEDSVFLFF